jgi:putative ABC transport system permease protein
LGIENPINHPIYKNSGRPFKIVGVVPDIVYGTLHGEKSGIVFNNYTKPDVYSTLTIRVNPENFAQTMESIRSRIAHVIPNVPVQIKFYNTELMAKYEFDYAIKRTVLFFAIIAALLTVSGLVGYSINAILKRIKEIGVRKVNGASEWTLLGFLNRGLLIKCVLALLLFSPLAWYIVNLGLENYAYHIAINPWVIVVLSAIVIVVVFVTISLAVWNIVKRNPVDALRYE